MDLCEIGHEITRAAFIGAVREKTRGYYYDNLESIKRGNKQLLPTTEKNDEFRRNLIKALSTKMWVDVLVDRFDRSKYQKFHAYFRFMKKHAEVEKDGTRYTLEIVQMYRVDNARSRRMHQTFHKCLEYYSVQSAGKNVDLLLTSKSFDALQKNKESKDFLPQYFPYYEDKPPYNKNKDLPIKQRFGTAHPGMDSLIKNLDAMYQDLITELAKAPRSFQKNKDPQQYVRFMGLQDIISYVVKENEKKVMKMIRTSLQDQPWEVVKWRECGEHYYNWEYVLQKSGVRKGVDGVDYNIEFKITVLQSMTPLSDQKEDELQPPRRVEELYDLYSVTGPGLYFNLDLKEPGRYQGLDQEALSEANYFKQGDEAAFEKVKRFFSNESANK